MSEVQWPKEDVARRGDEIYERIRADMESKHYGKIVAIDLNTGFYGIGATYQAAAEPVFEKDAAAEIWFVHVGRENMTRFGLRHPAISAMP